MANKPVRTDLLPWYRYPWPWILMAIPLSAVVFGVLMITMVTQHPDDLVVDNYYKDGMAINQSLAMDEKAQTMGVRAVLGWQGDVFNFVVSGANDSVVVMELFHVTDKSQDKKLMLYPEKAGTDGAALTPGIAYTGGDNELAQVFRESGIWYLQLSGADDGWRLRQRIETPLRQLEVGSR